MQKLNRTISKIFSRVRSPKRHLPLPPEIWLAVFEDIDDMSNVRLTCTSFAALGKVQAFSSLKISPFILAADGDYYRRWAFTEDVVAERLNRLDFWASDDIAPFVRHCKVYPQFYSESMASMVRWRKGHAKEFINAVFQRLPLFLNLHRLEISHIPVSEQILTQLCQLKALRTLEVTDCTLVARIAPRPPLDITNIHFYSGTGSLTYRDWEERGDVGWLDVLNPDTIRRICISFNEPKVVHLHGVATKHSLCDSFTSESERVSRHILSILSHPSALEELKIYPFRSGTCEADLDPPSNYTLGSLSLPSLQEYDGPYQYLSWVTTGPELRSVSLITLDQSPYASSTILHKTIQQQNIGEYIQCLTIRVDTIPDILLIAIRARFSRIKVLKMYAKQVDEDEVSFFSPVNREFMLDSIFV
jgi:hypothetical protein